jgi:hypothetical protein
MPLIPEIPGNKEPETGNGMTIVPELEPEPIRVNSVKFFENI